MKTAETVALFEQHVIANYGRLPVGWGTALRRWWRPSASRPGS
ncbi:MAG: hypothetical protein ACYTGB_02585 [Planctomycetota bacterium]|jgi:hypothetical protein